jgi:hypothetical protein
MYLEGVESLPLRLAVGLYKVLVVGVLSAAAGVYTTVFRALYPANYLKYFSRFTPRPAPTGGAATNPMAGATFPDNMGYLDPLQFDPVDKTYGCPATMNYPPITLERKIIWSITQAKATP